MIELLTDDFKKGRMEVGKEYEDVELILRTMARESRHNRILLSKKFIDFINSPKIRARLVSSYSAKVYVFLTAERNESREDRKFELKGRCLIVRKYTPEIDTVIGIATEKKDGKKGFSLDVVYLYKPKLSEEEEKKAEEFIEEFGWFKNSFKGK